MKELSGTHTNFRSDINGLRAWAVTAVVLYHFGVSGFGGGFVGVDVFFVISGFLMTGIVVKDLERGSFSLAGFFMARGRRIVPALIGLCAVLLALGWFVLLPADYKMLASHAIYSMSFLSNIEFWQEAGYFDVASHEKWLLHTWSLSVEWQFYMVLPVMLWAVWHIKPGRSGQAWGIGAALLASFAASVLTTDAHPSAAFFLLHTRAWEMLGGGLVFLLAPAAKLSANQRRWLESIGLFLIVLAIAVFNKDTAWPGWRAMLPVIAAMMVLVANRSSFWTGNKLAQWLGDRSYSLYLWHWPVVVALVYVEIRDDYLAVVVGIALTMLLGHCSYNWVENPARRWFECRRFSHGVGMMVTAAMLVALPAVTVWKQQGIGGRFAPSVELAAAESNNSNPRRHECLLFSGLNIRSCVYGGSDWKVITVGDSHAGALVSAIADAQQSGDAGVVEWTYSGCAFIQGLKNIPAVNVAINGSDYKCREFIEWAEDRLTTLPENIPIVIINRYAAAAFGNNEHKLLVDVPLVYFSKVLTRTTPEFLAEFAQHITQGACELAKHRTVYMVRPIPEMGFDVPKTLSRRMALGVADDLFIPMEAYLKRNAWVWAAQDAASDQCGIKILDPTPYLCNDGRCYGSKNGRPLYHDDDHLSEFGNKLLVPMFEEIFREL